MKTTISSREPEGTTNWLRPIVATALLLSVPLVAMQFSADVNWDLFDFGVAAGLLLGVGYAYEFLVRCARSLEYRLVIGALLFVVLLLLWIELAVGIFGTPFAGS
jgi:hypothetical protein